MALTDEILKSIEVLNTVKREDNAYQADMIIGALNDIIRDIESKRYSEEDIKLKVSLKNKSGTSVYKHIGNNRKIFKAKKEEEN